MGEEEGEERHYLGQLGMGYSIQEDENYFAKDRVGVREGRAEAE